MELSQREQQLIYLVYSLGYQQGFEDYKEGIFVDAQAIRKLSLETIKQTQGEQRNFFGLCSQETLFPK